MGHGKGMNKMQPNKSLQGPPGPLGQKRGQSYTFDRKAVVILRYLKYLHTN